MQNRNFSNIDKVALQNMYKRHRLELKKIRSTIDNKPSMIRPSTVLQIKKMRQDDDTFNRINTRNKSLLQKINKMQDIPNKNYRRMDVIDISTSKIKRNKERLDAIERSNFDLGCRILRVKSSLNTRRDLCSAKSGSAVACKVREKFEVPLSVLERYSHMVLPRECRMLEQLLRPKIFLEIELQDVRPLGRIVIQLFTEACPDLVLEFVRMCSTFTLEAFRFIRVFPQLWVEAELKFDRKRLREPGFEYDMYTVNHARGPGVLSFAKGYLSGFSLGLINFSVSYKPMNVLNGERVPFGVVISGMRNLECLKDYGMRSGKLLKDIITTRCGLIY